MSRTPSPRRSEHEPFAELAVGWALHALEPEDEVLFARHLPDCRRCELAVSTATEVLAAMARDLPDVEPPPGARGRLLAAVEDTEQLPSRDALPPEDGWPADVAPTPDVAASAQGSAPPLEAGPVSGGRPNRPAHRPRQAVSAGLAVAAVAAIVGLGAWNVFLTAGRDDLQSAAAAQSHVVAALLRPGHVTVAALADAGGNPVATVAARGSQVEVITQGLAVDDARTHTYVLWGLRGGASTPLGTFDVGHPQMDLRTVGSPSAGPAEFPAYAISLETGRQAPPGPTEIVATGQVRN